MVSQYSGGLDKTICTKEITRYHFSSQIMDMHFQVHKFIFDFLSHLIHHSNVCLNFLFDHMII